MKKASQLNLSGMLYTGTLNLPTHLHLCFSFSLGKLLFIIINYVCIRVFLDILMYLRHSFRFYPHRSAKKMYCLTVTILFGLTCEIGQRCSSLYITVLFKLTC